MQLQQCVPAEECGGNLNTRHHALLDANTESKKAPSVTLRSTSNYETSNKKEREDRQTRFIWYHNNKACLTLCIHVRAYVRTIHTRARYAPKRKRETSVIPAVVSCLYSGDVVYMYVCIVVICIILYAIHIHTYTIISHNGTTLILSHHGFNL